MASYTFLQLCNQVVAELGLPALTTVYNNPNQTARQVGALMNRAGDEMYQDSSWIVSQAQHIVEIEDAITTTGSYDPSSNLITSIPSTTGIVANQFAVVGGGDSSTDGLQTSTRVIDVVNSTTVEIDMVPLGTAVATDLIFARDTYAVPDDFKWFANQTMWDRTNHWQLVGPLSPQAYQLLVSGIVPTGPRRRWRQIGEDPVSWRIWPPPTASNDYPATLEFEYNSKYWARTEAGVPQQWLTLDDDYPVIDGQALVLHTKWRFNQAKGFSYGPMQAEAIDYVNRLSARDGGSPDLSLSRPRGLGYLIGPENIPDGSWPSEPS